MNALTPDLIVRLAAAAVATLLAVVAMIALAIRRGSLHNVIGVVVGAVILVGFAVAAFGPDPVSHALWLIFVCVAVAVGWVLLS